jgi:hypothetical protein
LENRFAEALRSEWDNGVWACHTSAGVGALGAQDPLVVLA